MLISIQMTIMRSVHIEQCTPPVESVMYHLRPVAHEE